MENLLKICNTETQFFNKNTEFFTDDNEELYELTSPPTETDNIFTIGSEITKKLKGVDLNPKMDIEEAQKAVKVIEDNLKKLIKFFHK